MRRLLGAIQFLTIIPVRTPTIEPSRAAALFPLVGAALGLCGGLLLMVLEPHFPVHLRTLLVLAFWIAVTGALHEDGLADVADAFRAERPREQILEILKDSRIGTFGGLALVVSVAVRWQGLVGLTLDYVPALVAVMALSRAAIVVLARLARPATDGLGSLFAKNVSTATTLIAVAQAVAAAAWCGWRAGAAMLALTGLIVLGGRWYFQRRIGGVTGDCLGAVSQVVEMGLLVLLACQSCMW
jgi:adenosylcobinamide-GDP ribazoletransferase